MTASIPSTTSEIRSTSGQTQCVWKEARRQVAAVAFALGGPQGNTYDTENLGYCILHEPQDCDKSPLARTGDRSWWHPLNLNPPR